MCLRLSPPYGKDRPASGGIFRFFRACSCCRSSVVEHSIGNGEVDSSILSGSTSLSLVRALQNLRYSAFNRDDRFQPFRLFQPEQTVKRCVS